MLLGDSIGLLAGTLLGAATLFLLSPEKIDSAPKRFARAALVSLAAGFSIAFYSFMVITRVPNPSVGWPWAGERGATLICWLLALGPFGILYLSYRPSIGRGVAMVLCFLAGFWGGVIVVGIVLNVSLGGVP